VLGAAVRLLNSERSLSEFEAWLTKPGSEAKGETGEVPKSEDLPSNNHALDYE
jgi:hypothetical protein